MIDAERAVLGACMVDPQAYWRIADTLAPEDFSDANGRTIFATIRDLARSQSDTDAVTVGESCPAVATLAIEIASSDGWRTANVAGYATIVAEHALARRVKSAGQAITHLPAADAYGEAQRLLAACAPRSTDAVRPLSQYLRESVAALQERFNRGATLTGVPTGLPQLDDMTSGLQAGDLVILAARPSVGKTALAVQVAVHAARAGHRALVFSLEMSGVQLADRVQSHVAHVDSLGLRDPRKLDDADYARLFDAVAQLNDIPMLIDASSALTVDAISARVRQAAAQGGLGLVVLDYLTQIMPPKAENTNAALQIITRQLKALAKDVGCPVLLLSQLNRQGEHRPTLSALRDSGAIEQDADVVLFLHRPDPKRRDRIMLIVEKQRNGPTGEIWLDADMAHMRFTEGDEPMDDPEPPRQRGFGRVASGGWRGYQ